MVNGFKLSICLIVAVTLVRAQVEDEVSGRIANSISVIQETPKCMDCILQRDTFCRRGLSNNSQGYCCNNAATCRSLISSNDSFCSDILQIGNPMIFFTCPFIPSVCGPEYLIEPTETPTMLNITLNANTNLCVYEIGHHRRDLDQGL